MEKQQSKNKTNCNNIKPLKLCCCGTTIDKCNFTKKGVCNNSKSIQSWT